jgi:hypothetical protein
MPLLEQPEYSDLDDIGDMNIARLFPVIPAAVGMTYLKLVGQ